MNDGEEVHLYLLDPVVRNDRYAILVGINTYQNINNLRFCVNDVTDWRSYLEGRGWVITSFLTDAQATEGNIMNAITNVLAQADGNDLIVFVQCSHGASYQEVGLPGQGSVLCCHDSGDGTNGNIQDTEFQQAWGGYTGKLFVFLDACRSGGMDELITADPNGVNRYMTTTCTENGFGFDREDFQNGAWTYWFLERGLIQGDSNSDDMEGNFQWALLNYPYRGENTPQQFDGDPTTPFYLWS